MPMAIFIRVSGPMIWLMAKALLLIPMVLDTSVNGKMIFNMVKERRVGIMERLFTMVPSSRVKSMVRVDFHGKTAASTREILMMGSSKAMANTTSLTWINGTKENSDSVTWRAEV